MEADVYSKLDEDGGKKMIYKMARDRDENSKDMKGGTVIKDRNGKLVTRAGSNYTKLYQLQLHLIFYFNYNYNYSHNFPNQLQLHCFNYNYIMRNQIYSAFVNYVFLHVLLNLNILHTIDKQI